MLSFQNILIPTDFSQAAWQAVQFGLRLLGSAESNLTLLHVFPNSVKYDRRKLQLDPESLKAIDGIRAQMEEFCEDLGRNSHVKVTSVILDGAVDHEIMKFVEKHSFDLVIMGVNSSGTDNRPGTHVRTIIEKANAPVLIIPNKLVKENIPA